MPGQAAFDKAVVDGSVIGPGLIVPGSASLRVGGSDRSSATADGRIRNVRVSMRRRASFKALGDWSQLSSRPGASVQVTLYSKSHEAASFKALVSASYDESSRSSSVELRGGAEPV